MKEAEQKATKSPTFNTVILHNARTLHWPPARETTQILFLFIPGNPGLCDQCSEYLSKIHRHVHESGASIEIYCPSQLGHDPLVQDRYSEIVTLDEQISNKVAILETALSRHTGSKPLVILGGHSIGAWMVLEMLKRGLCKTDVHSIHLLFPAMHQLSQMPNGKRAGILFRAAAYHQKRQEAQYDQKSIKLFIISTLIYSTLWFLRLAPYSLVRYFVKRDGPNMPSSGVKATTMFFKRSDCAEQALCMANEQFTAVESVQSLPLDTCNAGADVKMRFYWGAGDSDGWAPSKARVAVEQALSLIPYDATPSSLHIEAPRRASIICQQGLRHAFFLRHSLQMANVTAKLLKEDLIRHDGTPHPD